MGTQPLQVFAPPSSPLPPSRGLEPVDADRIRSIRTGGLHVLLVEDDPSMRNVCAELSVSAGCKVTTAGSVPEARALVETASFEVIFLDLHLPGGQGSELFDHIRAIQPRASVVVMTAQATIGLAVGLMRSGAFDFLHKPFELDRFVTVLEAAEEQHKQARSSRELRDRLAAGSGFGKLIGASPEMQKVFRLVAKVASTRHPVLILGEEGTGKEAVARAIHANGPVALAPFIPVDCSPLAPDLLERDIFGSIESDVATNRTRQGLLAAAGQGTLFFDEVSHLSLPLQARLVRALEERRLTIFGGTNASVPFQARVLAGSSRNLQAMVESGRFRKDLYYRLNIVKIEVPPLRKRSADVLLLADHFLRRQAREHGIAFGFSDEANHFLEEYQWAGNVRELENVIERACALSSNPMIHLGDLGTQVQAFAYEVRNPSTVAVKEMAENFPSMQETERNTILSTLKKLHGDKVLTAKVLGIGKSTLYRRLKEFGIGDAAP